MVCPDTQLKLPALKLRVSSTVTFDFDFVQEKKKLTIFKFESVRLDSPHESTEANRIKWRFRDLYYERDAQPSQMAAS